MVQNKGLYYIDHPTGLPVVGKHLEVQTKEFDYDQAPPSGGITIKTNYVSFDPYQRGRMRAPETKSYSPPFVSNQPRLKSTALKEVY
jgi:NADPH-dependent curcumin reductase CurA